MRDLLFVRKKEEDKTMWTTPAGRTESTFKRSVMKGCFFSARTNMFLLVRKEPCVKKEKIEKPHPDKFEPCPPVLPVGEGGGENEQPAPMDARDGSDEMKEGSMETKEGSQDNLPYVPKWLLLHVRGKVTNKRKIFVLKEHVDRAVDPKESRSDSKAQFTIRANFVKPTEP